MKVSTLLRFVGGLVMLFAATSLSAQTIRGVVVDTSGTPVPGVVVLLVDSASNSVARALTNERGEYRLTSRNAGSYALRTMRIGFRPATVPPQTLGNGQEIVHRVTLTGIPFPLSAVRIAGKSDCSAIGDPATFAVWEQIRTALIATQLTVSARAITATTVTFDRTMDAGLRQVLDQSADVQSQLVTQPWRSISPDSVRRIGYIFEDREGWVTYAAPGLDVLLSDQFVVDHCFRLTQNKRRIGVVFVPAPARRAVRTLAEIRGTIWVDRETSELQSLEYRYVTADVDQEQNAGGDIAFARLTNGAWVVARWTIRMPELERRIRSSKMGGNDIHLVSMKVTGGELALATRGTDTLFASKPLALRGTVVDSASGAALANAQVTIAPTQRSTTSDGRGQFRVADMFPGQYRVEVRTPALDSLNTVHATPIAFTDGDTAFRIRVPTATMVLSTLCARGMTDGAGILLGRVRLQNDTLRPVAAKVVAEWSETASAPNTTSSADGQVRWIETRTDARGSYRICGVPLGAPLKVRTSTESGGGASASVTLSSGRVARVDLIVDPSAGREGTFTGAVFADTSRRPIEGAEVAFPALTLAAVTAGDGTFRLASVPAGTHRLTIRRLGFAPLDTTIKIDIGQTVDRRVYLRRVVALDSVNVTAERITIASFEENRRMGLGHFYTRDFLAKHEGQSTASILLQTPGLAIVTGRASHAWIASGRGRRSLFNNQVLDSADVLRGAKRDRCYAHVFIDGSPVFRGLAEEPLFDINSIAPDQIEAIEYYAGPSQTPAQYSYLNTPCGVVVIWLRRAR